MIMREKTIVNETEEAAAEGTHCFAALCVSLGLSRPHATALCSHITSIFVIHLLPKGKNSN